MIRFIDLFAGIGGFHYGLERANSIEKAQSKPDKESRANSSNFNRESSAHRRSKSAFNCVWANEFNKYAGEIYQKRFPKTSFSGADIRTVDAERIPEFDLLVGGFPCQAFSIAGKRKGFNDTRGTLFFEIARIIKARRPKIVLLENVRGLLSHEAGRTFGRIIQVLGDLGYWVEWQVLNSKNFGVPQNRERVFIVGHLRGKGGQKIFPLRQNGLQSIKKRQKIQQIAQTLKARDYASWRGNFVTPEIAGTFTAGGHSGGLHSDMTVIPVLTPNREEKRQNGRRFKEVGDPMFTLTGQDIHGVMLRDGRDNRSCLRSGRTTELGIEGQSIRRLTPVECERLQGFPDHFTEGLSDTQRYKCLGNAVTTNVITALGKKILEAEY